MNTNINDLPKEIFMIIIDDLNESDIVMVSFSCKKWNNMMIEEISELSELQSELTKHAAYFGYKAVLEWAKSCDYRWNNETASYAAQGGHLEILKWLREEKYYWDRSVVEDAAFGGQIEVLKWLWKEKSCKYYWTESVYNHAASGGQIKVLKWLFNKGLQFEEEAILRAAYTGQLKVLKWFYNKNARSGFGLTIWLAAKKGHLKVLKWLFRVEKNMMMTSNFAVIAAKKGHSDILKWIWDKKLPINYVDCIKYVARNGDLEILKWMIEVYDPKLDTILVISRAAAKKGHLDIFKWIKDECLNINKLKIDNFNCINSAAKKWSHQYFRMVKGKWLYFE